MKKDIIISFIIILCVITGNIITQNYTKNSIETINMELADLREKLVKEETKDVNNKVKTVKEKWDEMQEKLAFYIEHDELEKVETQIFMIEGNANAGLYKEIIAELDKCSFILKHIGDKTALNIKNIF